MRELDFKTFDNKSLHLYVFDDVVYPKGVIQIAHGMQESCKTYFEFAEFLNSKGYYVVMFDERAHGMTAESVEKLGYYDGKDLFMDIVKDECYLSDKIKERTSLPLIFFGHSYGSFIGQRYIQGFGGYDKLILSGSSYMKTPLIYFGKFISDIICLFGGENKSAKLHENLSFKAYSKHFTDGSWITSDETKTKEFYDDERNGTSFPTGFYKNMFKNQLHLYSKKGRNRIDTTKPILLISGAQDTVGEFGKGTTRLYKFYKNLGIDVTLKLYENARHGVCQEKNRKEVFEDVLSFIEKV